MLNDLEKPAAYTCLLKKQLLKYFRENLKYRNELDLEFLADEIVFLALGNNPVKKMVAPIPAYLELSVGHLSSKTLLAPEQSQKNSFNLFIIQSFFTVVDHS